MDAVRSLGLLSTREAAKTLECSIQHVRLLMRQGKIDGEKVGRDWFATEESITNLKTTRYERTGSDVLAVKEAQVETLFPDLELQTITNVASVPQRSPFRYPGGKTWLIPTARHWLNSFPDNVTTLIEPFAGGGGISLMAAFEGFVTRAMLVELDPDVAVVWRVLINGRGPDLADRLLGFELNEASVRGLLKVEPVDDVGRAFLTIIRNRVSRGGILAPGAGLVKNGEAGKGIASRWYPETLARRIHAIHENRSTLAFTEDDGLEVIANHADNPQNAFFIDPPYPVAGQRLYRFHNLDHRLLFGIMSRVDGPVLATYDNNPEIEALALEFGFDTRLVPMKSTHHNKKFELLISRDFDWLPTALNG
jgi:DNA adenine methylase